MLNNKDINSDNEKVKRIRKELLRLNKIYAGIDENKYKIVSPLIQNVAFMTVTMQDLETTMNINGLVQEYSDTRGQPQTKRTAEADAYLALSKNYLAAIKELENLCPPAKNKESKLETLLADG